MDYVGRGLGVIVAILLLPLWLPLYLLGAAAVHLPPIIKEYYTKRKDEK